MKSLNPDNVPLSAIPEGWRLKTDEDQPDALGDVPRYRAWAEGVQKFTDEPAGCYGHCLDMTYIIKIETPDPAYVSVLSKSESIYHKALQEVYFLVEPFSNPAPDGPRTKLANQVLNLIKHLV